MNMFILRILWGSILLLAFNYAQANVQCWVNGAANLNFGTVKYSSSTSANTSINYACQTPWDATQATYYIRLCSFIDYDPAIPGIEPRYLQHWSNSKIKYDIYSDAANTKILGPVQSSYPISSWVRTERHNAQLQGSFIIYGLVPLRQNNLIAGPYESHFMGGRIRWRWSRDITSLPNEEACQSGIGGEGGGDASYYINVTALAEDACFISAVSQLDFGVHTHNLNNPINSQGTISIRCPLSVNWSLNLNSGLNSQGNQRYMLHSQGNKIAYELYKDTARTQPWENGKPVSGTGAGFNNETQISIYGKVPVQFINRTGEYTDTITVTLFY